MDRHWFPAITLGFTVLLGLVFVFALSPRGRDWLRPDKDVREVTVPASVVTEDGYRQAVGTILSAYASSGNAQAAYDALILLRVPASSMNVHYELVIAMQKAAAGDKAEAAARFTALQAQYPWLNLSLEL